jgi:hypothetical protein
MEKKTGEWYLQRIRMHGKKQYMRVKFGKELKD